MKSNWKGRKKKNGRFWQAKRQNVALEERGEWVDQDENPVPVPGYNGRNQDEDFSLLECSYYEWPGVRSGSASASVLAPRKELA